MKKEFIVIFIKKHNVWPYIISVFDIDGEKKKKEKWKKLH